MQLCKFLLGGKNSLNFTLLEDIWFMNTIRSQRYDHN